MGFVRADSGWWWLKTVYPFVKEPTSYSVLRTSAPLFTFLDQVLLPLGARISGDSCSVHLSSRACDDVVI